MTDPTRQFVPLGQFKHPRYWPTWLGMGCMWVAANLPYSLQLQLGKFIGFLSYHFARERRRVCEINLRLCFPNLSPEEHRNLVQKTFRSSGIGFIEIAIAWCGKLDKYRGMATFHGLENLEEAKARNKGVLLIGPHLTTFEMAGFLYSSIGELNGTYRANDKNPLFDAFMYNGRHRLYPGLFERKDIRGAMRCLKKGGLLWYAPDQDYGAQHSVFVPFFGNLAATITAGSRFAKFNGSPVVFFSHYRRPDNSGYEIHFSPVLEDYPSGDDEEDGRIINRWIEAAIRRQPDQYLWLHKRFKTPLPGKKENPYRS